MSVVAAVAGSSPLHRLPAGRKLLVLVLAELLVAVAVRSVVAAAVALVVTAGGYAVARLPMRVVWRSLRTILLVALVVGAAQWWYAGPERGAVVATQLLVAVALAVLTTLTTRTSELLDALERGLKPLQHLGIDTGRVSLTLALTVRSVPVVAGLLAEIREAARARGLRAGPATLGVPLVVRTLRHAEQLGEALAARGVDD